MKIFEITDAEEALSIGCLLYYEKEKSCIIELQNYLDEWNAPLLFAHEVKNGRFTVGRELSSLWVRERVIPSGRQNIDSILANAKLQDYDEMELLEKSGGKCCQDSMYIKRLSSIPKYVAERMKRNLVECVTCRDYSLLCFFADGAVRKVGLSTLMGSSASTLMGSSASTLMGSSAVGKLMSNELLFRSGHIAAGGYCVTFNDSIDIDAKQLYESGTPIPLSLDDFLAFMDANVMDTSECCAVLGCSRQNLTNYLSKGVLVPVKKNAMGNLYTKGNIYRSEAIDGERGLGVSSE